MVSRLGISIFVKKSTRLVGFFIFLLFDRFLIGRGHFDFVRRDDFDFIQLNLFGFRVGLAATPRTDSLNHLEIDDRSKAAYDHADRQQ